MVALKDVIEVARIVDEGIGSVIVRCANDSVGS